MGKRCVTWVKTINPSGNDVVVVARSRYVYGQTHDVQCKVEYVVFIVPWIVYFKFERCPIYIRNNRDHDTPIDEVYFVVIITTAKVC